MGWARPVATRRSTYRCHESARRRRRSCGPSLSFSLSQRLDQEIDRGRVVLVPPYPIKAQKRLCPKGPRGRCGHCLIEKLFGSPRLTCFEAKLPRAHRTPPPILGAIRGSEAAGLLKKLGRGIRSTSQTCECPRPVKSFGHGEVRSVGGERKVARPSLRIAQMDRDSGAILSDRRERTVSRQSACDALFDVCGCHSV